MLLCIITAIGLIPIEAFASSNSGVYKAGTSSGAAVGGGSGTFLTDQTGYRISVIDGYGKTITKKVDFVFKTPPSKGFICSNNKVEGLHADYDNLKAQLSDNLLIKPISELDRSKFGDWPTWVTYNGNWGQNGTAFNQWFMKGVKSLGGGTYLPPPAYYNPGSSSGNKPTKPSNTSKPTNTSTPTNSSNPASTPKPTNTAKPESDYVPGWDDPTIRQQYLKNRELQGTMLKGSITSEYNRGIAAGLSHEKAKLQATKHGNNLLNELKNQRSQGKKIWRPEDINYFSAQIKTAVNKLKAKTENLKIRSSYTIQSDGSMLFDLAYAASNDSQSTEAGHVNDIFWLKDNTGDFLFKFNNGVKLSKGSDGKESIIATICDNGYFILVEPVLWLTPEKIKNGKRFGAYSDKFYGTPTNYGQFVEYMSSNGIWSDDSSGNSGKRGRGGNYNYVINLVGAFTLHLSTGQALKGKSGTIINEVVTKNVDIYSYDLAVKESGYAVNYYWGDPGGFKPPATQTYDPFDEDPNITPHKAPDPDPNKKYVPLVEGEPKQPETPDGKGYKQLTRTVNIVKYYDIQHADGSIEHKITKGRVNNPGTIAIMHEPDYKVIHWYTTPFDPFIKEGTSGVNAWIDEDDPLIAPTEWETMYDVVNTAQPRDTWVTFEKKYDFDEDGEAGKTLDTVTLGVAADLEYDSESGKEPNKGYNDTTLYVRLIKKEKVPETSTYDEPDNPPTDNPPYVPPHPAEDPTQPGVNDPETDPVEEGNPYCHYRIVKVYDTKLINKKTGETEIVTDNAFSTFPTNPIVYIQDEGQNNPKDNDPSWHLIEWMYGNEPDEFDENNLMSGDEPHWDHIIAPVTPKKSGTSPTKVNLIDTENYSQIVVLYVHLRRTQYIDTVPGKINIEQSQISKAIHSNDKNIGDKFGDYKFDISIGNFQTQHTYTYTIPVPYSYPDGYGGYTSGIYNQLQSGICQLQMPGTSGDNQARFVFDQIGSQHKLEVKLGTHSKTDARVYGNGGASGVSRQDAMQYPETVPGMTLAENHFKYTSDGKDSKGAEYVTVLWRGGAPKADIPTLAKFKEKDIKNHYGVDNWEIPNAMLKNADRKSRKQRATAAQKDTLSFQFGFSRTHSAWDEEVYASCLNMGAGRDNMVGCIYQDKSKRFQTMEGTSWQYPFKAAVAIQFYAGKSKSLAAEAPSKANIQKKGGAHYVAHVTQGEHQIKFYPYIRMTYMLPNLDDAIAEEDNTYENGHPNPGVRYDTYVLAERESSILPSDAIQLGWKHKDDNNTLTLTSQQWSLHKRAISGSDGWQGRNQVLPGGAIYQLATKKDDPAIVQLITYNTVVDDKARQEYLTATNTIPSDVYVVWDAVDALKDFVNDAKEVLDNLNIVQWVNKNANASTAWNANFQSGGNAVKLAGKGEDLSPLNEPGRKVMTANLDDKYYMRGNTFTTSSGEVKGSLTDFQSAKISDRTYEIRNNTGKMKDEQSNSGDLDVSKVWMVATVYKTFTDTQGNVYYAKREKTLNGEAMENAKVEIENMVKEMKDINGDNLGNSTLICGKTTPYSKVNELLNSIDKGLKVADDLTKYVTNTVKSVERNTGDDSTASWVGGTSEKRWYNEAFDGFYLVKQEVNIETTFQYSPMRVATLDPALCPVNRGQSDLYTKAFLSQFCVDSRSDAAVADGKGDHYIGTYDGVDMFLPDMELMYQSKKFYIPNANVQDLN